MKKLITRAAVSLLVSGAVVTAFAGGPDMPAPMVTPGLYLGLGGSWNTVDMTVSGINESTANSAGFVTLNSSTSFKDTQNRLAPMAQLGYWAPIDDEWLWGLVLEYKYLNYNTSNANTPFKNNVVPAATAFTEDSLTARLQHEVMLLLYFGAQYDKGYFYLGLGPVLFTLDDSVRRFVNTTASNTSTLSPNSVASSTTVWGGAAQLGYNYYFKPTWFLGFNYTYTVAGDYTLSNTTGANAFSAVGNATSTNNDTISRTYGFTVQEVMFSINKVFEM